MQYDDRPTRRVATLLHIDTMAVAHIQHALVERVDWRIQILSRALMSCFPVHFPPYIDHYQAPRHAKKYPMTTTIDASEVQKFEAMAAEWWDVNGKFKPLHMLNPCRLDYITTQIAEEFDRDLTQNKPFEGLRILDIGCGGGLLSEPMARLGATVIGADAAERNIPVARLHAEQSGLTIDYRHTAAEDLVREGLQFDVVLNMEVVEHVSDPAAFMRACHDLLAPGGLLICSTINRNAKSFAMAIVGAEYVMRWLPKGTHEWQKFITPDELENLIRQASLDPVDKKGFVFNPIRWDWSISPTDLSVNYVTASVRPK